MLRTTKNMKDRYKKIQEILFELIPEKWEDIYLYASSIGGDIDNQSGEMYFYYKPKGILKKKPVNVYEVPKRFNINESDYLKLIDNLYDEIKKLKYNFYETDQKLWTNLTIYIGNCKFKVEFFYDDISGEEYASYRGHVMWRYKYLHMGGEINEERNILKKYYDSYLEKYETKEEYQIGLYVGNVNNRVGFDKEIENEKIRLEETELKAEKSAQNKQAKKQKKEMKQEEKRLKEEAKNKSQILK